MGNITVMFDNNFFAKYSSFKDYFLKFKISYLAKKAKVSFYLNDILVYELLKSYDSEKRDLFVKDCEILCALSNRRIFNRVHDLVNFEVGINKIGIFQKEEISDRLLLLFEKLSRGKVIRDEARLKTMLKDMNDYKASWFKAHQSNIQVPRDVIMADKKLRKEVLKTKFKDYYNSEYVIPQRKDWIYKHFNIGVSQEVVPREKVEEIISEPDKYPFLTVYSKVFWAYHFYQAALGRRIDENDLFDAFQLIYAAELNYFVTEDKRFQDIGQMVFNDSKVVNFSKFCSIVRSYNKFWWILGR